MTRKSFQLMSSHPSEQRSQYRNINITSLIEKQRAALCKVLTATLEKLKEDEMAHREEFRDQKLADCFHPSTSWMVSKLYEAIWSDDLFPLGKSHVKILSDQVDAFENGLAERGRSDTATYTISKIRHAFNELEKFFVDKTESKLTDNDAEIFIFFVEGQIAELDEIAKDIDKEYDSDVE